MEAIKKDPVSGFVTIDQMLCVGCKSCIYACPISIPQMSKGLKVAVKCDMCAGEPECIKVCSAKAIKLMTRVEAQDTVKRLQR
jgi:Fe-S-cluster-containing hydrogenase component 2